MAKMEYAMVVFSSARKFHINILERIHREGLRLCIGAYRTSPSILIGLLAVIGEIGLGLDGSSSKFRFNKVSDFDDIVETRSDKAQVDPWRNHREIKSRSPNRGGWNREGWNSMSDKIENQQDLAIEIIRLWKQNKVIIVPLIMSVSGLTPNTFTPHVIQLGLDEKLHKNFQTSVILKTCSIVRSFLNSEQQ
nr:unnamed protein product [Callosobruchus analis]